MQRVLLDCEPKKAFFVSDVDVDLGVDDDDRGKLEKLQTTNDQPRRFLHTQQAFQWQHQRTRELLAKRGDKNLQLSSKSHLRSTTISALSDFERGD